MNDVPGRQTRPSRLPLWCALAIYGILVALAGWAQKEQLNSDAVCYLRNAFYLSEGRLSLSVSGYWSPLLSWSIVPFLWLNVDGVYAGHLAMALWGGLFVGAAYYFMRIFTRLSQPWDILVMSLVAVKAVTWVTRLVTPDIVLTACLLVYCAFTVRKDLLRQRRYQLAAGVLGGLAYLAKSYGLPFFLVHLTGIVAVRYWLDRARLTRADALRAWATALGAFLVIAGPWIGILSAQHGKLTFSTVAQIAHSVMGPNDKARAHPTDQLRSPSPERLTVWETPQVLPYNHWSPLENRTYFVHQLKLVGRNAAAMIGTFGDFDFMRLFPGLLLILPALCLGRSAPFFRIQTGWVLWTIALYAGGFLPIFYEARYVAPFLWPLCVFYLFDVLAREYNATHYKDRAMRFIASGLLVVCAASFLLPAAYELQGMLRKPSTTAYRNLAQRLMELGHTGPLAVSPGFKTEGMLVSYHNSQKFLGPVSREDDVTEIETSLEQFGANVLLVRETKWPLAEQFLKETRWNLRQTFDQDGVRIHILTPPLQKTSEP